MKNLLVLFIYLLFLAFNCVAQNSSEANRSNDLKAKYESARIEFENFEKAHGGFVKTKNTNLHFLEWGNPNGFPLIWIHGSFTNAYELADLAEDIVKCGYYLIAIDYYGHGQTEIPNHEVSLYHVADDINALMKEKGIQKALIGGWSRGGMIATAFYDDYPEKVLGLILEDGGSVSSNTFYHKLDEKELVNRVESIFNDRISYQAFDTQFEAYTAFYDYEEEGNQFKLLAWIGQNPEGKWTIGAGVEKLFNMSDEEEFLNTVLRPTKASLFGESMAIIEPKIVFRNLKIPILILDPISEGDIQPFENENRDLAETHPSLITHKIYEDTGHNIHYERPKEFVDDLGSFLISVKKFWLKR